MNCKENYIPSKLESSLFKGDMQKYTEALYKIFTRDFLENDVYHEGKRVDIIHEKYYGNMARSFWHIVSEGDKDSDRTPISWRAECIAWVKALIEDNGSCSEYKKWIKYHDKTKRNRHYIWCTAINYMVVLEDRGIYFKLITAYPVMEQKVKGYKKEYEKYIKENENAHPEKVDEISAPPTQG